MCGKGREKEGDESNNVRKKEEQKYIETERAENGYSKIDFLGVSELGK